MQNHTNMCIALYSLQNAFTYTSSFIPSSFPSIKKYYIYNKNHAWHQGHEKGA